MQQKLCSRPLGCLPAAGLPLRCPRCGDQERFGSLASLRAHLEYRHAYHTADPPTRSYSVTGKHPEDQCGAPRWQEGSLPTHRGQQTARGAPHARAPHARSLSDSRGGCFLHAYGLQRRRTQSVGVGTQDEEEEDYADREEEEGGTAEKGEDLSRILFLNHLNLPSPLREPPPDLGTDPGPEPRSQPDPGPGPGPDLGRESGPGSVPEAPVELGDEQPFFGLEAAVRGRLAGRLAGLLRAADSTMQRRLAFVSTELAQTDTELLCERAHSQHLAQERQEAAERERSLSRQVDVAVMVIAALREQLNASENELERREREALTIQRFLEAAVRQETCGKVRIQQFIENLLKRIALAERLVEYYQETSSPAHSYCQHQQQISDHAQQRMSKSRDDVAQGVQDMYAANGGRGQLGVNYSPVSMTTEAPPPPSMGAARRSPGHPGTETASGTESRTESRGSACPSAPSCSAGQSTATASGAHSAAGRRATRSRAWRGLPSSRTAAAGASWGGGAWRQRREDRSRSHGSHSRPLETRISPPYEASSLCRVFNCKHPRQILT